MKRSTLLDIEAAKNKEKEQIENEIIQKTKLKIAALEQKLRLSQLELDEPKQDIKKERKDYEKEYLAQYKKQQKSKPKKGHQNS